MRIVNSVVRVVCTISSGTERNHDRKEGKGEGREGKEEERIWKAKRCGGAAREQKPYTIGYSPGTTW